MFEHSAFDYMQGSSTLILELVWELAMLDLKLSIKAIITLLVEINYEINPISSTKIK